MTRQRYNQSDIPLGCSERSESHNKRSRKRVGQLRVPRAQGTCTQDDQADNATSLVHHQEAIGSLTPPIEARLHPHAAPGGGDVPLREEPSECHTSLRRAGAGSAKRRHIKTVLTATVAEYFRNQIPAFLEWLKRDGMSEKRLKVQVGPVKHFLVWLDRRNIELSAVDGRTVRYFLRHKCDCPRPRGTKYRVDGIRNEPFKAAVLNFVAYLEASGIVQVPFDRELMAKAAEQFIDELRRMGKAKSSLESCAHTCRHFLAWCSIERVPVEKLSEDHVAEFARHDCVCRHHYVQSEERHQGCLCKVRRFIRHLRSRRVLPPIGPRRSDVRPQRLSAFRRWLERHRGCSTTTIDSHIYRLGKVLPMLGDDPSEYTATSLQQSILHQLNGQSRASVQGMTTALRFYLRFLGSEQEVDVSLIGAIPRIPEWKLSSLPKYILADDVERVIEACDVTTPKGLRDRAIILLLARLALRRGDIFGLRMQDIDWDNAIIRVCGKSRRWTGLPLPQDVGDALADYIEHGRPRMDEEKVFLRVVKPFKPFVSAGAVGCIARTALERAKINNPNLGGAQLFRHSAATNLLRAGSSLEEVGALLRHTSPETTAIYAKVDTTMLATVVQPWIGGES